MDNKNKELVTFGLGVGAGICGVWLLVEMLPLIALGGAGYLILKGLEQNNTQHHKENNQHG